MIMALECPFCGADKTSIGSIYADWDTGVKQYLYMECQSCFAKGPLAREQDEAIKRWSMRNELSTS